MVDWLTRTVLHWRIILWCTVVLATVLLWRYTPPIKFDQSVESFFPDNHPALISYQESKKHFGGDHLVFVAYDDPELLTAAGMERVRKLADAISDEVPGVERVDAIDQMPIPSKVDDAVVGMTGKARGWGAILQVIGGMVPVKALARSVQNNPVEREVLRKELCTHPLFEGLLIDSKGQTTAIVVRLKDPEHTDQRASVRELRKVGDDFAKENKIERVAVAGPPVLIVDGFESLDRDNRRLGLVAMGLMALTMLFAVRNPSWALLPLLAGWATWEITRAFLVYFDLRLSLSSGPIVAQTIVLCMPAASHLASRFSENLRQGIDRPAAERLTLQQVFVPIAWCSMTAASGYLAMWAATTVAPVAQFGLTMFFCNLMAGALAWCLGAGAMGVAFRSRLGEPVHEARAAVSGRVGIMTDWVMTHHRLALIVFAVPMLLATIGMSQLQFESNYINVYRPTARIAQDYRFIEDRMGGIGLVELVFPAPEKVTPEWLKRLTETAGSLKQTDPELVSAVVSLADILTLAKDMKDSDPQKFLDLKIGFLSDNKYSHFLTNFWDRDGKTMRILVRIRESAQADRKEACFNAMQARVRSGLSKQVTVTGLSHLMTQITQAVVWTSFLSGMWSAGISLVMLWIALRSFRLGLLALMPTLLAVGLVMGVMGWIGLKIDMSTVFVASVAIGLSVDDAFHCLLRWKETIKEGKSPAVALREAYAGSGAGVVLSSAGVSLGFLAMLFSEFMPMFHFGWLISVATLGGSLGNLVVIPAILAWVTDPALPGSPASSATAPPARVEA